MTSGRQATTSIHTHGRLECFLCGSKGILLYDSLKDRLFGAPGEWHMRRCSNHECRLVWLDPAPIAADIGKVYQDYHTHSKEASVSTLPYHLSHAIRDGYLRSKFGYTRGVGPRWYQFLSFLAHLHPYGCAYYKAFAMFLPAPKPSSRLLDVGCGNGYLAARMRDMGWQVEGTEVDSVALEQARSRGIVVHLGELDDQSYDEDYFDAVQVSHVIEHVDEPIDLIKQCYRVLKPSGTLVMRTPNIDCWGHRHFSSDWRGLEPPRHLNLFNRQSILVATKRGGFNSENIIVTARVTGTIPMSIALRYKSIQGMDSNHIHAFRQRLIGMLWVYWERALLLARPELGEELVIIAKK